jgi:hypothetical protein
MVWVLVWVGSAALAYLCTEGAVLCCSKRSWDRPTREFALVCSVLLGPVYLLIAAELLLLAAIGNGLAKGTPQRYKP